jgi:hypothetical protein
MQGIREIMEFRSDRGTSIFVGLIAGALCAVNLAIFFVFREEGWEWFSGFIDLLTFYISAAAFTYSNVVRIDKQGNTVEKIIKALFWEKRRMRMASNFRRVGIATAGGGPGNVQYFVQLLGSKNINIPGLDPGYEDVLRKAEYVAQCLNLPVDEKPKIGGVFGLRF